MQNNSKQVTAVIPSEESWPGPPEHRPVRREWIREIQVTDSKSLGV